MIGLGVGLWNAALNRGAPPILRLFANSEDGFLFSPMSVTERLFLLSNGSTGNVAADSDPVGLILDNHSWGLSSTSLATIMAAQTELLTGSWTMSVGGGTSTATESPAGTLTLFNDGVNSARGDKSITTVVGRTYMVVATQSGANAGALSIGTSQGGTQIANAVNQPTGQTNKYIFVATATTTWIRFSRFGAGTAVVSAISSKLIPGNHALQATTTKRLAWKANVGSTSYVQGDGTDDALVSPFLPNGSGLTMALEVEFTAASKIALGGGISTGDKQASIGLDASGFLSVGWGTAISQGSVDRRNTRMTVVVTGNGSGRDVWVDNVKLTSFTAASGAPDGTGGGMALAAFNNNGTPQDFSAAKIYRALVINRKLTDKEVTGTVGRSFRQI